MSYTEPDGMECGEGWKDIIDRTHEKLKYLDPDYNILQIKEKFGGLRYYFNSSDCGGVAYNIMHDVVSSAEREASYTCELCGAAGMIKGIVETRVDNGLYYTYCKECSDKFMKKRREKWSDT